MRLTAAASVVALGTYVVPAGAQTSIYDPNLQPQPGQVFPVQPNFGNQPTYVDPSQQAPSYGQPLPQPQYGQPLPAPQPGYGQQIPNPNFGQQQPNFGQPLQQPQPSYGQPLPQPQNSYGQPVQQQPTRPIVPSQQENVPYYQRAQEPSNPQSIEDAVGANGTGFTTTVEQPTPSVDPALQADSNTVGPFPAPAGGGADRAPTMAGELSDLIRAGERYRAASPGFLEDLKILAEKYRDPLPQTALPAGDPSGVGLVNVDPGEGTQLAVIGDPDPNAGGSGTGFVTQVDQGPDVVTVVEPLDPGSISSIVYLEDDFTDGEIESNPPWNIRQGVWQIDPKYGLRAKPPATDSNKPIRPKELLQVLIDGADESEGDKPSVPQAALIENQVNIGNAFSLAARITDHEGKGAAHFIMHQGGADWLGYRLELRSGPQPVVVLTRRGSNGYKDITKVQAPAFTKGESHELRWARLSDGQMFVILNGRPIITSRDTVFRENWSGFAFFNAGGDVSIRAIRIAAPVER